MLPCIDQQPRQKRSDKFELTSAPGYPEVRCTSKWTNVVPPFAFITLLLSALAGLVDCCAFAGASATLAGLALGGLAICLLSIVLCLLVSMGLKRMLGRHSRMLIGT